MIKSYSASAPLSFRNRIVNGDFRINQRAVAGSVVLAAGAYGHDRWKAGAGGCSYTFAAGANGDVTITVTAGTLLQVVEGGLYLREGGAFTLSWAGTAQARVYQGAASGAYAAGPIQAGNLSPAVNTTVEFGLGTVTTVQLEPGGILSAFERRDDELQRCQRYFEAGSYAILGNAGAGGLYVGVSMTWGAPKRSAIITINANATFSANAGTVTPSTNATDSFFLYVNSAASGNVQSAGTFTAACEL